MNTSFQDRSRVLIVDDQRNWREALHDMLDIMFEVETAASYDEAKQKLQERAFHVLVADQRLVDAEKNNIQGIVLLDEVSRLQDGTQAIIVTGYPTIEAAKKALKAAMPMTICSNTPRKAGHSILDSSENKSEKQPRRQWERERVHASRNSR